MPKWISNQKVAALYYGASLLLISLFPFICQLAQDQNLPPLNPSARLAINLILLNLGAAYVWLICPKKDMTVPNVFWLYFFLVGLAICAVPPVFSGDLYEYLMRGRILGVYHQNPYAHASGEFPQDPLFPFSVWNHTPENYGPAWVLIQWIMPTFFGGVVSMAVAMHKMLMLGFLSLSGLVFYRIANKIYPAKAIGLTQAFVLNPNLWVQHVLDGHNDIVMVFWMLLAAYLMLRAKWVFSTIAATLAVLVKFSSLFILPALFIATVRQHAEEEFKKKGIFFLKQTVIVLLATVSLYLPFWIGGATFKYFLTFKEWFYSNSVPYAFHLLFVKLGVQIEPIYVKRFFILFFLGNAFSALLWLYLKRPYTAPLFFRAVAWIFLTLHASYAIPFYGNHLSWSIPFLILSGFPMSSLAVTLISLGGIFAYFKRLSFLYLIAILIYFSALILWKGFLRRKKQSWAVTA